MAILIVVVLVAAVAVLTVLLLRARGSAAAPAASATPRDPFDVADATSGDPRTLRAGDMVEFLGERMFVRGSLRLREGGFTWSEHFLDAVTGEDEGRRWISVEEDPDLEVMMWSPYRGPELSPSARTLTVDGVAYRRDEHGVADFRSEGTTGVAENGRVEYADFEGPGGRALAFERFLGADGTGSWEAALGERVPTGTLVIYPGSDT